jgi:hypothetical protein
MPALGTARCCLWLPRRIGDAAILIKLLALNLSRAAEKAKADRVKPSGRFKTGRKNPDGD